MTYADIKTVIVDGSERRCISVVQEKTGTKLLITISDQLQEVLDAWPRKHMVILVSARGKPLSANYSSHRMAEFIAAAGLPERCVLHGLRYAAARLLAEAGCTGPEIMSITGHKSLAMVEKYIKAADQVRGAAAAIAKLEERIGTKNFQTAPDNFPNRQNLKAKSKDLECLSQIA